MLKHYELTDQEWEQIASLLPSNKGKKGRPQKDNRQMLNAMVWLARSGAHGETFQNVMVRGHRYIAGFVNGSMTESLTISFGF